MGTASEPSAVGAPQVTAATLTTLMAELAAVHQQLDQVRQSVRTAFGTSNNPQPAGTGRPASRDAVGGVKPGVPLRPSHSRGELADLYPHPSGGFLRDPAESHDSVGSLTDLGEESRYHVEDGKKRGAERVTPPYGQVREADLITTARRAADAPTSEATRAHSGASQAGSNSPLQGPGR